MELLITQAEINNYLSSLDFDNVVIRKVMTSLQLLRREYFINSISLLIDGKLTINDLNNISINDLNVKNLIDSILASPTNINEKSIFYKNNVISQYSNYNFFLNNLKLRTVPYISRKNLSSTTFCTEVNVDNTGLKPEYFSSLQRAKIQYNLIKSTIVFNINFNLTNSSSFLYTDSPIKTSDHHYTLSFLPSSSIFTLYVNNALIDQSFYSVTLDQLIIDGGIVIDDTTYILIEYETLDSSLSINLNLLYNKLISEVNQYRLIYNKTILPLNINFTTSISGFLLRIFNLLEVDENDIDVDTDTSLIDTSILEFINLQENLRMLASEMASDYDIDLEKNGIPTITRLLREYQWSRLSNISDPSTFINELAKIIFLRITVPKWIGGSLVSNDLIANETRNLNIVLKYLYSLKVSLKSLSDSLKDNLYANVS